MTDVLDRYDWGGCGVSHNFDRESVLSRWMQIELAALHALEQTRTFRTGIYHEIKKDLIQIGMVVMDPMWIPRFDEREAEIGHDVAAFVDVVQMHLPTDIGRWFHYGLTSSDLVDTALHWNVALSINKIRRDLDALMQTVRLVAGDHTDTICLGRTHGQVAEPTTFGCKMGLFGLTLHDDMGRLGTAEARCMVGKLAGPVGTHTVFTQEQEQIALDELGLRPVLGTQVISRQRIADAMYACAMVTTTIAQFALEFRLLAQPSIGEVYEGSLEAAKGSSSMPHKKNPVQAERLCGLARLVQSLLVPTFENIGLWHERDISHSSVERITIPEALSLTEYAINSCRQMVQGMHIDRERMWDNFESQSRAAHSHHRLSRMIRDGMTRDEAYRLVQSGQDTAVTDDWTLKAATVAHGRHVVRAYRERLDRESSG